MAGSSAIKQQTATSFSNYRRRFATKAASRTAEHADTTTNHGQTSDAGVHARRLQSSSDGNNNGNGKTITTRLSGTSSDGSQEDGGQQPLAGPAAEGRDRTDRRPSPPSSGGLRERLLQLRRARRGGGGSWDANLENSTTLRRLLEQSPLAAVVRPLKRNVTMAQIADDEGSVKSSEYDGQPGFGSDGSPHIGSGGGGGAELMDEQTRLRAQLELLKNQLTHRQDAREAEVVEFLRASNQTEAAAAAANLSPVGSDNPQLLRIRQKFDKRQKKHAAEIEQLQRRIENISQRLAEFESSSSSEQQQQQQQQQQQPVPLTNGKGGTPSARSAILPTTGILSGIKRRGAEVRTQVLQAPRALAASLRGSLSGSADNLCDPAEATTSTAIGRSTFYTAGSKKDVDAGTLSTVSDRSGGAPTAVAKSRTLPAGMAFDFASYCAREDSKFRNDKVGSGIPPAAERNALSRSSSNSNDSVEERRQKSRQRPGTGGTPMSAVASSEMVQLMADVRELRELAAGSKSENARLHQFIQHELQYYNNCLNEERLKYQKLEERFQEVADLNQRDMGLLQEELIRLNNRLEYQLNENSKRVVDARESMQQENAKLEQWVRDSLNPYGANRQWSSYQVMLSLATVLAESLKIVLYLVAVTLDFFRPFTGTRTRSALLIGLILLAALIVRFLPAVWSGSSSSSPSSS